MNWYIDVIKKYAVFTGRARRKEYLMFMLFNFFVSVIFNIFFYAYQQSYTVAVIMSLYSLALLLPVLGVTIRRLHDTGRSGWWIFLGLIPIIGAVAVLVFLCLDSEPGANQYGENPKE